MTFAVLSWTIAIPLLGFVTGLRTMMAMAVLCWFAYRGLLEVNGTWAFWVGSLISAILFTLLAFGECIGDKLARTPDRISLVPLMSRLIFGGLVGAIAATGLAGSVLEGVILGVIGAILGAFGGYVARRVIVERTGWPDWRVALAEDILAVFCAAAALGIITG